MISHEFKESYELLPVSCTSSGEINRLFHYHVFVSFRIPENMVGRFIYFQIQLRLVRLVDSPPVHKK